MASFHISLSVSVALACSVSFVAGYAFNRVFGYERSAARQAIVEAQSFQRVMAAYQPIVSNQGVLVELEKVTTLNQLEELRFKYRERTLASARYFVTKAKSLELPEERAIAAPFLAAAEKTASELNTSK